MTFTKSTSNATLSIEKGANIGVTLYTDDTVLTMQLDTSEAIQAAAVLHSKGELYDEIRRLHALVNDLMDRNEELRKQL